MRRAPTILALVAITTSWLIPASAQGAMSASQDCSKHAGTLTQHYSIAALNHALQTMSPTVQEYSVCSGVIQAQIQAQLSRPQTSTTGKSAHKAGGGTSAVLIAVIAAVVLAGIGFAVFAGRRRADGDGDGDSDGDSDSETDSL